MKFAAILAGALALAAPAQAQPAAIDALFAAYTPATPGCAVGVKPKDQPPVFRGYGSADLEHGVPITPETIFEAGSVSKQFTAAAILLLVDDGKLALSDDIRKHLPEMPDYGRPVTVDMLLSHTSGLRDWGEVMALAGWPRTSRVYNSAEVLQIAARQRALNYTPGEAYSYTNTGYNLAAAIVQRVSGYSLADFTRLRIFLPLGMSQTSWRDNFRRVVPGRAVAYRAVGDGFGQEMPFENTYGHGGLLTTVGDLLIWNDALSTGALGGKLDARMKEQAVLMGGRKIAYARGLVLQTVEGRAEVAHSGSTAGYRAWLARLPKDGLSVAVLCNRGDANPVQLGRKVVDAALGVSRPAPVAAPTSADDLARLPGVYVDERTGGVMRIVAQDGALRVRGTTASFQPTGPGRYRTGEGVDLAFSGDGLTRRGTDGEATIYRRVAPAAAIPADLAAIAGAYASSEAGALLVATVRGDRLTLHAADRPSNVEAAAPLYRDVFSVDGNLVRVLRAPDGKVTGLRFTGGRVHALDFRRVEGS